MKALNKIQTQIQEINKKLIYHYDYHYHNALICGGMTPDDRTDDKFGPTRAGYDLYKQELREQDFNISYSGEVSLRTITDKSGEPVGYITETKKPLRPWIKEADDLYDNAYQAVFDGLNVQDKQSFDTLISIDMPEDNPFRSDRVQHQLNKVQHLMSFVDNFEEDENYRMLVKKVIG